MKATPRLCVLASFAVFAACSVKQKHSMASGPADAFTVSVHYADAHYPPGTFQPNNARLQYIVEDQGDTWKVELAPIGYSGGGLSVAVRKSDMKITGAWRTQ
jgi:hypothetical protein